MYIIIPLLPLLLNALATLLLYLHMGEAHEVVVASAEVIQKCK